MPDLFNQLRGAIDAGIPEPVLSELLDELTSSYRDHQRWKSALPKNKAMIPESDRKLIFNVLRHRRGRVVEHWIQPTIEFLRTHDQ